jgi:hypothetical protein
MTYESTGEIRKPLIGEYYLSWGLSQQIYSREVYVMDADATPHIDWKRIIMRPIDESF